MRAWGEDAEALPAPGARQWREMEAARACFSRHTMAL